MRDSQPARSPGPQVTAARRAIVGILDPDYCIPYPRRSCDARHKVARPHSSAGRTAGSRAVDWSGAYSERQRALAARDFADWAAELAPQGIHTLFGHNYGGEVAARAVSAGTSIRELVLLSTPITSHVETASQSSARMIDVRLRRRASPILHVRRTGGTQAKGSALTVFSVGADLRRPGVFSKGSGVAGCGIGHTRSVRSLSTRHA
jgi:pimeloyl-ACP methyl ester carboxylesterase